MFKTANQMKFKLKAGIIAKEIGQLSLSTKRLRKEAESGCADLDSEVYELLKTRAKKAVDDGQSIIGSDPVVDLFRVKDEYGEVVFDAFGKLICAELNELTILAMKKTMDVYSQNTSMVRS